MKVSQLLTFIAGMLIVVCLMAIGTKIIFPSSIDLNYSALTAIASSSLIFAVISMILYWRGK